MIVQGIVTALSVGMGCGTCCGSGMSVFLFGYLTSHTGNMRRSVKAYLSFYLGKILAVTAVCAASSVLGRQILDDDGNIGNISIHFVVDLCMIAAGIWLTGKWIREKRHSSCERCNHCSGNSDKKKQPALTEIKNGKINYFTLAFMGAGYGISPCAPLIMMVGYAATTVWSAALITGCIFAAASAFVPMILLLVLSGVLSSKIQREIPQYMDIFRLLSYIILIAVYAADLFQHH